jgi:MFS family permease
VIASEPPKSGSAAATPPAASGAPESAERPPALPRNVVALGVVSLLTDVSSEMIVPVLPLFLTTVLRVPVTGVGIVEGIAESTASVLRIGSGWLSDRIGLRKPFVIFGYGLSALAKGALALAHSFGSVLGFRFLDRVGKGLRSPPRDALIADSVDAAHRGRAFGFHRAMDTTGAAIGPLVAFALLSVHPDQLRRIFTISLIPGVLAVLVVAWFVRAPRREAAPRRSAAVEWRTLGAPLKRFMCVDGLFQLGNSSMAFLLLKTRDVGFSAAQVTLVYLGYNVVYAALALPLGSLSDRIGRRPLIIIGYVLYAFVYALFAFASTPLAAAALFMVYGVHSALMEGQQKSLIADLVPADARATAYGAYYTVVGMALLPASALAGLLWDRFGSRIALGADAALALGAALLFVVLMPARREWSDRRGG